MKIVRLSRSHTFQIKESETFQPGDMKRHFIRSGNVFIIFISCNLFQVKINRKQSPSIICFEHELSFEKRCIEGVYMFIDLMNLVETECAECGCAYAQHSEDSCLFCAKPFKQNSEGLIHIKPNHSYRDSSESIQRLTQAAIAISSRYSGGFLF